LTATYVAEWFKASDERLFTGVIVAVVVVVVVKLMGKPQLMSLKTIGGFQSRPVGL
jgi:hypothetical protein